MLRLATPEIVALDSVSAKLISSANALANIHRLIVSHCSTSIVSSRYHNNKEYREPVHATSNAEITIFVLFFFMILTLYQECKDSSHVLV